ncbi:MAG: dihydropteroate synthase [Flavobacteriia bacterium]
MSLFGVEIKHFRSNRFIRIRNKLIEINHTLLMGILNITPDSFFENSRIHTNDQIDRYLSSCIENDVSIVDIGGNSSRPDAIPVDAKTEIERIGTSLTYIKEHYPNLLLSVDTFYPEVADWALSKGVDIINDVQGGRNYPEIWDVCAKHNAPYILTHSKGNHNASSDELKSPNITTEVLLEISTLLDSIRKAGVNDVIIDVGFGFSKTLDQNYELLSNLELFQLFETPILCGFSRKSMIYKKLNIGPEDALNGTTVLNTFAITQGCDILRVHDPKEARQILSLLKTN